MSRKFLRIAALTAALALAFAGTALAVDYKWTGGGGADKKWTTKENWDQNNNYPGFAAGDTAFFDVSAVIESGGPQRRCSASYVKKRRNCLGQ